MKLFRFDALSPTRVGNLFLEKYFIDAKPCKPKFLNVFVER